MILLDLKTCLNCGSFAVQTDGLCAHCEARLMCMPFAGLDQSIENNLPVFSLFDWVPQESDLLSKVTHSLKGRKTRRSWEEWALKFWRQRVLSLHGSEALVFIPAPSTTGKPDHAFYFAQALAAQTGGELWPLLQKTTKAHQRVGNREQRSEVGITSRVKIADPEGRYLYVFVDDILTTGSTAHNSYLALGKPVNFEVWVLAKRTLSCGVSVDLL